MRHILQFGKQIDRWVLRLLDESQEQTHCFLITSRAIQVESAAAEEDFIVSIREQKKNSSTQKVN